MTEKKILRNLGDGLILRCATVADADELSDFNACLHTPEQGQVDMRVAAWTRDLLTRPHPTFQVGDFTVVEDTQTGKIVSSLNLISQTWSYAGIEFGVGRPELVGTLPEYRNRGLVRAQFEIIHQCSAARGEKVQAITGIPYYYRQFGYEMALDLGGGRAGYLPHIPRLADGKDEPYRLRPAVENDLPLFSRLYQESCQRSMVSCVWNEDLWKYELSGKSADNVDRHELRVIETPAGEAVGVLAHPIFRWGGMMSATFYELVPGTSWTAVTPSVIRYLQKAGESLSPEFGSDPFGAFGFWMGCDHPVYHVIPDRLPRKRQPYAWYIRVPDLAGFILHLAPALEKRLAASHAVGYTGEMQLTFYNDGLHLAFEKGKLVKAEKWRPAPRGDSGAAGFPGMTFLQLLFGYRSVDELRYAFADCWIDTDEIQVLLEILFPKLPSSVWPVA